MAHRHYYTTNKGDSWVKVSGVQQAKAFGFGKALGSSTYPAVYINGQINGQWGIWRSGNQGTTWDLVSIYPAGIYDSVSTVNGDMNIAGRVYVGLGGNGYVYGDSSATGSEGTPVATPSPLPNSKLLSPWQDGDIGAVGQTGSATYTNSTFTVNSSGTDIWNGSDQFNYAYQHLNGDGTIVARVASMQNTDSWAKAGVMIRETLNVDASYADMVITPGHGANFQWRATTGGTDAYTPGSAVSAPYWVKLTRAGNTLTGYTSTDGSSWTQEGSVTIAMANSVYIGLAVTAHNNSALNSATFDNVTVSDSAAQAASAATAPAIDGSSSDAVWSTAASYTLANTLGSPSGFSASYQSAWDKTNLYVLVKVQDASYAAHADLVELYLDPTYDVGTAYDSRDMQYQFPSNSTTVTQYSGGQKGTNTTGITFANQAVSGGYQVEIAIPWSTLGVTPAAHMSFGLDLDVWQDFGSGVKNKVIWHANADTDWNNPSVFGSVTLQGS